MKIVLRIANVVVWVFLIMLLIMNIYNFLAKEVLGVSNPQFFGFSSGIVISGSMEPALSVDDIVIVEEKTQYELADIITYNTENQSVTHRIVAITDTGYRTKGDSNNTIDNGEVKFNQVQGKVQFVIPKIGWVARMLRTPLGVLLTAAGILLYGEVSKFIVKRKKKIGDISQ